jgi:hypothetical protein
VTQPALPFLRNDLGAAFTALRNDLVHDDGPRISTMRNYRFAILVYPPAKEFDLRKNVQRLTTELSGNGWIVNTISLQRLMMDRIARLGEPVLQRMEESERRLFAIAPERGLNSLASRIQPLIEGPDGLAADCARLIADFASKNPEKAERTVTLIGRAGALYPFFRTSALLKHLDGRTGNVPVVLLYPGRRDADTTAGLSFMGELHPDRDYRPRIYG